MMLFNNFSMNIILSILNVIFTKYINGNNLYMTSTEVISTFTKLALNPYSGIQECLEACNKDDNCDAIGIKPIQGSDQVECYVNNGTGSMTLDSTVEVKVKHRARCVGCPSGFTGLGSFGGCYRMEKEFS